MAENDAPERAELSNRIDGRKTGLSTQGYPLRKIVERVNGIHITPYLERQPAPTTTASTKDVTVQPARRHCNFCGKPESEVELIQATVGFICRNCVAICAYIIRQNDTAVQPAASTPTDRVQERGLVVMSALINFIDWLDRERGLGFSEDQRGKLVKQFLDAHQPGVNYFYQAEQIAEILSIPFHSTAQDEDDYLKQAEATTNRQFRIAIQQLTKARQAAAHTEEAGEVCRTDCEGCNDPVGQLLRERAAASTEAQDERKHDE